MRVTVYGKCRECALLFMGNAGSVCYCLREMQGGRALPFTDNAGEGEPLRQAVCMMAMYRDEKGWELQ